MMTTSAEEQLASDARLRIGAHGGMEGQYRGILDDAQPWGTILLARGGIVVSASARAQRLMRRALPSGLKFADVIADSGVATGMADIEALRRGIELDLDEVALWLKAEFTGAVPGIEAVVSVIEITALRHSLDERTTSLRFLLHDLRSPLNSIVALTQLETSDREAFERCGGMRQIGQLARYVLSLGEQFIVSSIATRLENQDFCRFDLREMVLQMIPQLEVTALCRSVALQLCPFDEASVWVSGMRNFVARAFQNLIDNAIHASRAGERITVALRTREGFADIVVSDRAGGLPGLKLRQTVTDFGTFSNAGTTGFGIGLKLAQQITELHGGTLRAESIPGEGTAFVMSVPATVAAFASRSSVPTPQSEVQISRPLNGLNRRSRRS